MYLRKQIFKR